MTKLSPIVFMGVLLALCPSVPRIGSVAVDDNDGAPVESARFLKAVAGLKEAEQALYLFERIEKVEERKAAGDGKIDVKVSRVFPAGTGIAHISLGLDSKPTSEASYKEELEKLLSTLNWAATSGKQQHEAYEKLQKKQKERAELIDQTKNAFIFTYVGQGTRGDRTLSKFRMEPNPSYKPTSRMATIFSKVKGFVWLDEATGQMARVEGDVTDDISFGIFLGKIYKGSHFMQERYEYEPGVWLPSYSQYDFDARKLFSQISIHQKIFASHYKRVGPPAEAIPIVRAELEKMGASAAVHSDSMPH
jgi:hypothetical protein